MQSAVRKDVMWVTARQARRIWRFMASGVGGVMAGLQHRLGQEEDVVQMSADGGNRGCGFLHRNEIRGSAS